MDLTIGNNFFNEKFKDYLRNFYVYGYIPQSEFPGSKRTYHNDALRFEHIGLIPLTQDSAAPRWRMEGKTSCMQMVTEDSRLLCRNPVHVFYNLCEAGETDALFFLSVLLKAAQCQREQGEMLIEDVMDCTNPAWIEQWQELCRTGTAEEKKQFRDKTQAITRRRMLQEFGETRLLHMQQRGNNNVWTLPELTLDSLLQHISDEEKQSFLTGIDFFMKLGPFGEIGEMLLSRLPEAQRRDIEKNNVCMDQFYLSKALNDYNSADLLQAVHSDGWVVITYWQPQRKISGYVLCKPLNLRTSMANGREYVGYYDPVRRRAGYLRLEYIQSVELLEDRYVPWLVAAAWKIPCRVTMKGGASRLCQPAAFSTDGDGAVKLVQYIGTGKRARAVLCCREDGQLREIPGESILESELTNGEPLARELERAKALLEHSWGGSVPYLNREQTLQDVQVHTLSMTIYVWQGEEYIRRRLWREARFGRCRDLDEHRIEYTVEVLDPWEMIPWITSFAGRICRVGCSALGFEEDLCRHLRAMYRRILGQTPEDLPQLPVNRQQRGWYRIPNLIRDCKNEIYQGQLRNPSPLCRKQRPDHELLFAPLYSQTYRNCIEAFDRISTGDAWENPWKRHAARAKDIAVLDAEAVESLATLPKQGSIARFEQLLPQIGSVCRSGARLRDAVPLMMKLVPLTDLEQRWLLAVLQEPMMTYFLSAQAVDTLTTALKTVSARQPLFRREILAFDQYRHQAHDQPDSRRHFRLLRTAVKVGRGLHIHYRGQRKILEMDFLPLRIAYAIRDDLFRIEGCSLPEGKPVTLRLDMILEASLIPGRSLGSRPPVKPEKEEYLLEFPGRDNLPDRILTQLAPLRKHCTQLEGGICQLRFYAESDAWRDILTQILSFGSRVTLKKPDRTVQELQRRLRRQKNLWM
ncbi:MAG: WYL domain-containing protein [Oscillospiraceae bacterium]|nr:WYL domain-containing protein [Oscillospiraceae bacterium]MBQ7130858.1 WYL domain-containing protein [Oscillospiraceae bacterium]